MTFSILCVAIWLIVANVMAMVPSKDNHWRRAYILIAVGVPLIGWVTVENGPWIALLCLAAGMSVLRWPVIYLGRWLKSLFARS